MRAWHSLFALFICVSFISACTEPMVGKTEWQKDHLRTVARDPEYRFALNTLAEASKSENINVLRARAAKVFQGYMARAQKHYGLPSLRADFVTYALGPVGYASCDPFIAGIEERSLVLRPREVIHEATGHEAAHLIVCQLDPDQIDAVHGYLWTRVMNYFELVPRKELRIIYTEDEKKMFFDIGNLIRNELKRYREVYTQRTQHFVNAP